MKKLIYLLPILSMFGCSQNDQYWVDQHAGEIKDKPVIIYEGCEYLYNGNTYGETYTHKGNCKNPIHCFNKPSVIKLNGVVMELRIENGDSVWYEIN